ncbi:hypothetical protein IWW36_000956 [Coemansia brasiliensis]|uniref:ERCC4 domain-containing protein n=1 Tax=Coemansia brasiliensis TaxID=2650707 RepID=A0A9W8IEU9_9FUNG|nr:hypothetical protein IWW36_000956 [Coemansia brasiliensis]
MSSFQVIELLSDSETDSQEDHKGVGKVELTIDSDSDEPDLANTPVSRRKPIIETPDLPSPSRLLATSPLPPMTRQEALSLPSSPPPFDYLDIEQDKRVDALLARAEALTGSLRHSNRGEAISVSSLAESLPSSEPSWLVQRREPGGLLDSQQGTSEGNAEDSRPASLLDSQLGTGRNEGDPGLLSTLDSQQGPNEGNEGDSRPKRGRELVQANRKKVEPEEILRDMTMVVDKGVLQLFKKASSAEESQVFEKLREQGVVVKEEASCGIWWEMKVKRKWDPRQKMFVPLQHAETRRVKRAALVVMKSERFAQLVEGEEGLERLRRLLEIWRASLKATRLLVCVLGLQEMARRVAMQATQEFARQVRAHIRQQQQQRQQQRQRGRKEQAGDLEAAVLRMQVVCPWAGWLVHCKDSEQAFGQLLWQTTLDVGMAEFSSHGDCEDAAFDAPAGLVTSDVRAALQAAVVRTGTDMTDSWIRALAQIPKVTHRVAQCIVTYYPTPHRLFMAWAQQRTQQDREHLLAKIPVPNGISTQRKLGAFLSSRIYHILNETDASRSHM